MGFSLLPCSIGCQVQGVGPFPKSKGSMSSIKRRLIISKRATFVSARWSMWKVLWVRDTSWKTFLWRRPRSLAPVLLSQSGGCIFLNAEKDEKVMQRGTEQVHRTEPTSRAPSSRVPLISGGQVVQSTILNVVEMSWGDRSMS